MKIEIQKTTTGTTILLVGHGSRQLDGNLEIIEFSAQWSKKNPQWHIETCFIEFSDILLEQGLNRAAYNSSRVIVVPLILNAAGHVKMEIPAAISDARNRHPKVEFVYAKYLGATDGILSVLNRNLRQTLLTMHAPDPKTTGVILLGRGSSDRIANGEVAKMARWLFESTDHELVDIAFTGVTHPRLENTLQRQVKLGMTQIAILPYYLFTGTLIERIKSQTERLHIQYPQIAIESARYFGFENEIYDLLTLRVKQAMGQSTTMMECDGCRYREIAQEHGHHHQHEPDHSHHTHDFEVPV